MSASGSPRRSPSSTPKLGRPPGLATVLVGDDPASHVYVRNKRKACEEAGMRSIHHELPADTTEAELLRLVERLNDDAEVDGILVQLPLPGRHRPGRGRRRDRPPAKDVDGLTPRAPGCSPRAGPGSSPARRRA